jgi:hypothetical protein
MKALIQLAVISMLVFTSCKKDEIEDVKPANNTANTSVTNLEKLNKNPGQNPVNPKVQPQY